MSREIALSARLAMLVRIDRTWGLGIYAGASQPGVGSRVTLVLLCWAVSLCLVHRAAPVPARTPAPQVRVIRSLRQHPRRRSPEPAQPTPQHSQIDWGAATSPPNPIEGPSGYLAIWSPPEASGYAEARFLLVVDGGPPLSAHRSSAGVLKAAEDHFLHRHRSQLEEGTTVHANFCEGPALNTTSEAEQAFPLRFSIRTGGFR